MRKKIALNNDWRYSSEFTEDMLINSYNESSMLDIRLPHTNAETPFHYFDESIYQFVSCYRRHIPVNPEWKGLQVNVTFEGAAHVAKVYINEQPVTAHYGGYTAFSADIGPFLTYEPGEDNVLVVVLDSRETNNIPPFGNVIDYMTYGGIYREAYLEIKNKISITDAFVRTKLLKKVTENEYEEYNPEEISVKYIAEHSWKIQLLLECAGFDDNRKARSFAQTLRIRIEDLNGSKLFERKEPITSGEMELAFIVDKAKCWDIDHPNLYMLKLTLLGKDENAEQHVNQDGKREAAPDTEFEAESFTEYDTVTNTEFEAELDTVQIRFGFRSCEFREDGFYLNHRKIKLLGLNRHQSFPYVGYAMPKSMQEQDAEILKNELLVNSVRTSHYPQSQHFLNRCDELGLLVFTEIPGWQHIGDEDWKEVACRNVSEMILQNRNHPSIILWGVRINESQDDDTFYKRTNEIAHNLDPMRQTGGVRYLKKSSLLEDVYTYNDFLHNGSNKGLDSKNKVTSNKKAPYLVSEFNGHMFPTKSNDDEEHRLAHALRHAEVLEELFGNTNITGAFGWCMFDYNTHKDFGSGDRICYHGVMDMFRNPKLAASVYASQSDQNDICEISSSLDIGEYPAGDLSKVYLFTNADSIRLYKNQELIREFYPAADRYPSLLHPPVIVDDFIGNLMETNEGFAHKTSEKIKKLLMDVKKYGPSNLPFLSKLGMVRLMLKEHLSMEQASKLYYRYVGGWGGAATAFTFEAVKHHKVVKHIRKTPSTTPKMEILNSRAVLEEGDTYDVAEIRIRIVDENDNLLPYYQEPILLSVTGAIELIGPTLITPRGGMTGTYVRTTSKQGAGVLRLEQREMGIKEITFLVK